MSIAEAIDTQRKLNEFKDSLMPKLLSVAAKRNRALTHISLGSIVLDESGVDFTASGSLFGHYEHEFNITWRELELMS